MPNLQDIIERERKLEIEKALALRSAFESKDVNEIYAASSYLKSIQPRDSDTGKTMMVDPQSLYSQAGYKDKPFTLSFHMLRGMAKTHIIKAIITTRKKQVSNFLEPQKDKYSTGFVITKKKKYVLNKTEPKLTKEEESKIEYLTKFLLECGETENFWHADTFPTFIDKLVDDSMSMDQATGEIRRNRLGKPIEFFAVDGSTIRLADTYWGDMDGSHQDKLVQGYLPSYVQIYNNRVINEYYPWELLFGIRNPTTDIQTSGYGKSELEEMIQTVTAILNTDYYNANFFKIGSAPKGILRYSGNINQNTVEDFKRQWMAQLSGVDNMHKMAIINADKMDFINTQMSNKDMEFGKFQDFLIKIACAIFSIDPAEIGFPMQGASDGKGAMFEGSNEARLKWSKDKGLKPLLKAIQSWINKYIISQLEPEFEFRFVGIDDEIDAEQELDGDIKAIAAFNTVDEVRARRNLPKLPNGQGEIILNPVFMQAKTMAMQGNQDANGVVDGMNGGGDGNEENPFMESLKKGLEQSLA